MKRFLYWRFVCAILGLAFVSLSSFAGDVAVLHNGFSIRHERREVIGEITRLYVNADGSSYVDVSTADIDHFEAAPAEAPTPTPRLVPSSSQSNARVSGSLLPSNSVDLNEVVGSASSKYRLDPDLVASVIKAESGFNVHAVSPKGAQGLMQLMPQTAGQLGVPNVFDPQANVEGGTKYLRELLERYNFDLVKALAAYNAGPLRVEQYGGVPPYHETRAYVARIVKDFNNKKKVAEKNTKPAVTANSKTARKNLKPKKTGTAKQSASAQSKTTVTRASN